MTTILYKGIVIFHFPHFNSCFWHEEIIYLSPGVGHFYGLRNKLMKETYNFVSNNTTISLDTECLSLQLLWFRPV